MTYLKKVHNNIIFSSISTERFGSRANLKHRSEICGTNRKTNDKTIRHYYFIFIDCVLLNRSIANNINKTGSTFPTNLVCQINSY